MGARGGATARAWQHVWDSLKPGEFQDGVELSRAAAEFSGVQEVSIAAHLRLAAREGHLLTENRFVPVTVTKGDRSYEAMRRRTFYALGEP